MITTALITADSKLAFQIQNWMKEFGADVRLRTFLDLQSLAVTSAEEDEQENEQDDERDDESDESTDASKAKGTQAGVEKPKRLHRFGLYIVDLDVFLKNQKSGLTPLQWAASIKEKIEGEEQDPAAPPIRILFLAFETGPFKAENLRHDLVDDLIVKPLDRAMFMQKIELLIADKPGVKPSFLFRQKTQEFVEVGKDAVIDEISDFAVAIRNPSPLQDGVYAAIHSDVFGAGHGRVMGRVYRSERHPTHEGEFLVRFSLFGAQAPQMMSVRKYVREHHVPVRIRHVSKASHGGAQAVVHASKPISEPSEPTSRFAVIDMNQGAIDDIKSTFESHFIGAGVDSYPSYSRFLGAFTKLIEAQAESAKKADATAAGKAEASAEATMPHKPEDKAHAPDGATKGETVEDTKPAFAHANSVMFLAAAESRSITRFEAPTADSDFILGRTAKEWMERPDELIGLVESEDKEEFLEFVDFVASGGQGQVYARIHDIHGKRVYIVAKGSLEKPADGESPSLVRLEFKDIGKSEWKDHVKSRNTQSLDPKRLRYTAIFVDAGIVRGEFTSWYEGLKGLMEKSGVLAAGEPMPKIILLADEKMAAGIDRFYLKAIADFNLKPLDRKILFEKMHAFFPQLEEKEKAETPPFIPCEIQAKLGKDMIMEEISEYGLTIINSAPLKPNIFMRFFSAHFGPGNPGVIGRCSHCDKVEGDKSVSYRCHFTFFGTSDEVFKRIRTWIREDYVHKKEGAAG